ncbi:MAG: hypothetical protein NVSMB4_02130 [Acidimicrobiales bacterium]
MHTTTTSDAVAVVSASRFGYPGFVAEVVAAANTPERAAELAGALGEVAAAVEGVLIALTGSAGGDPERVAVSARDAVSELAELVVRCASEGDRTGIEIVCNEAVARTKVTSLICALIDEINRGLDQLDELPGPGANGLLVRLGLAAAIRVP